MHRYTMIKVLSRFFKYVTRFALGMKTNPKPFIRNIIYYKNEIIKQKGIFHLV